MTGIAIRDSSESNGTVYITRGLRIAREVCLNWYTAHVGRDVGVQGFRGGE